MPSTRSRGVTSLYISAFVALRKSLHPDGSELVENKPLRSNTCCFSAAEKVKIGGGGGV